MPKQPTVNRGLFRHCFYEATSWALERCAAAALELNAAAARGVVVAEPGVVVAEEQGVAAVAEQGVAAVAEQGAAVAAEQDVAAAAEQGAAVAAEQDAAVAAEQDAAVAAEQGVAAVAEQGVAAVAEQGVAAVAEQRAAAEPVPHEAAVAPMNCVAAAQAWSAARVGCVLSLRQAVSEPVWSVAPVRPSAESGVAAWLLVFDVHLAGQQYSFRPVARSFARGEVWNRLRALGDRRWSLRRMPCQRGQY